MHIAGTLYFRISFVREKRLWEGRGEGGCKTIPRRQNPVTTLCPPPHSAGDTQQ